MRNIPIFHASDDNYAPFLCTAIYSILEHTDSFIEFYILDGGITKESKVIIDESLQCFNNYSLEYIDMSKFDLSRFPDVAHYSLNAFSRYFIPEIKPEIEKALYLDVDIIVKKDVLDLYGQDLEGYPLGGVLEDFYEGNYTNLKENIYPAYEGGSNYLNSGVLLMDCAQIREKGLTNKLVDFTVTLFEKLACPDQDVYNIVFQNNFKALDYRFNFMPDHFNLLERLHPNRAQEIKQNVYVIHFTSGKPWKSESAASKDFWEIAEKTKFIEKIKKIYSLPKTVEQETIFQNTILPTKEKKKLFGKVKSSTGRRRIYFCGIKIFSYMRKAPKVNYAELNYSQMLSLQQELREVRDIQYRLEQSLQQELREVKDIQYRPEQSLQQNFYLPLFDWHREVIKSFYADFNARDNEILLLLDGLDEESSFIVIQIIKRLEFLFSTNFEASVRVDAGTQEHKKIQERNALYENILELYGNIFCYKQYKLPINHFESSVFVNKHHIDQIDVTKIKNKTILDVGAYIGDSALVFQELLPKKIFAFEAHPEHQKLMKKTIELNNMNNVEIVPLAVGDKEGEVFIAGMDSGANISLEAKDEAVAVKMVTLDSFVELHAIEGIALIKVDIEGAEQAFLHGAYNTIKKFKPTLLLSIYHSWDDFLHIKPLIDSWDLGYSFEVAHPCDGSIVLETVLICKIKE